MSGIKTVLLPGATVLIVCRLCWSRHAALSYLQVRITSDSPNQKITFPEQDLPTV